MKKDKTEAYKYNCVYVQLQINCCGCLCRMPIYNEGTHNTKPKRINTNNQILHCQFS